MLYPWNKKILFHYFVNFVLVQEFSGYLLNLELEIVKKIFFHPSISECYSEDSWTGFPGSASDWSFFMKLWFPFIPAICFQCYRAHRPVHLAAFQVVPLEFKPKSLQFVPLVDLPRDVSENFRQSRSISFTFKVLPSSTVGLRTKEKVFLWQFWFRSWTNLNSLDISPACLLPDVVGLQPGHPFPGSIHTT